MARQFGFSFVVVIGGVLVSSPSAASTLTVDLKGSAEFTDIQSAIDGAESGDTVLVKPGEYVISEPIEFNRWEDSPTWAVKNIVVRSERGAEETIIRLSAPPGNSKDLNVVVFDDQEDASTVLQGFTITGGVRGSGYTGVGICLDRSCPTIEDCVMVGNDGAGVHCEDGDPVFVRCRMSRNLGGGVYASGSSPTLLYCTVSENYGPGVRLRRSPIHNPPLLRNCTITANADYDSLECGGISCYNSGPTVTNCIVWGNIGGSVCPADPPPNITYSCIGPEPYPGAGNINEDPRFCGWKEPGEVHVDAGNPGEGTGTEADPFRTLRSALDFSLALSPLSPCLNSGENWTQMGSQNGTCMLPRTKRVIHLAAGTYDLQDLTFFHGASLQGAGKGLSMLRGTVLGLRSGATLSGVTVSGGKRGGIRIPGAESPEIAGCEISDNSSNTGGGIFCGDGSPRITDCVITRNSSVCPTDLCAGTGGGVFSIGGSPYLSDCTISENIAERGGGVFCGRATLLRCTVFRNRAKSAGGIAAGEEAVIEACTIRENSASGYGGGIGSSGQGNISVNACLLSGNSATRGGGACLACPASLTNCVIAGNQGNAVHAEYASPSLVNCTITGNRDSYPLIVSCEGNYRAALMNCILWANSPQDFCADASSCLLDGDPLFYREGTWDAGGTPDTADDRWIDGDYHLADSSPAIDAGSAEGAPTTDILGQGRPCGAGMDIGAYEHCPPAGFLRGDSNADGTPDMSDAVTILGFLFLGTSMNDCWDAADTNDDGKVDISDPVGLLGHLFSGYKPPPAPFGACGGDPTADALDCKTFSRCP